MSPIDSVLLKYETGHQLRLTKINALNSLYFLVKLFTITASTAIIIGFFKMNLEFTTVFCFLGVTFFLFTLILVIRKYCNALSIKGDNIILTNIQSKHVVTSIRSIKKLKNLSISKFSITKIVYNLDGIDRNAILIKLLTPQEIEPITIIKTILKKQKANL